MSSGLTRTADVGYLRVASLRVSPQEGTTSCSRSCDVLILVSTWSGILGGYETWEYLLTQAAKPTVEAIVRSSLDQDSNLIESKLLGRWYNFTIDAVHAEKDDLATEARNPLEIGIPPNTFTLDADIIQECFDKALGGPQELFEEWLSLPNRPKNSTVIVSGGTSQHQAQIPWLRDTCIGHGLRPPLHTFEMGLVDEYTSSYSSHPTNIWWLTMFSLAPQRWPGERHTLQPRRGRLPSSSLGVPLWVCRLDPLQAESGATRVHFSSTR
jgi:hypothetical protein